MRARNSRSIAFAGLLGLAGLATSCGADFKPASFVDKLRVLAIRAEPPELAPCAEGAICPVAQRAALTALVADPAQLADPARRVTVIYLACTPDPADPSGSTCTSIATLRDPSAVGGLLGGGPGGTGACPDDPAGGAPAPIPGLGAVGGVSFSGIEVCSHETGCGPASVLLDPRDPQSALPLPAPEYRVPPELGDALAALPAGAPGRIVGAQVVLLTLALAASPEELVAGADLLGDPCAAFQTIGERMIEFLGTRESVIALKRLQVRGPDAADEPNVNPRLPGILNAGAPLPAPLPAPVPEQSRFVPGQVADLLPRMPAAPLGEDGAPVADGIYQRYTKYDVNGVRLSGETEEWLYSWFATAGTMDKLRTRGPGEIEAWLAPRDLEDEPIPPGGRVFIYAVVRDLRGGIAFAMREVRVVP